MANSPQARKRARQAVTRRARNMSHRSAMRTSIKKVRKFIAESNGEAAKAAFTAMTKVVDGMINKGIVHKNAAARYKSRLNAQIKAINS